jgi:hypothetical protein
MQQFGTGIVGAGKTKPMIASRQLRAIHDCTGAACF